MIAQLVFSNLLMWCVMARAPPPVSKPHRDVVTTQGVVRGYFTPRPPHYAFLGLPYARPPTRYDRFKAPEPPPCWDSIFEAIHRIKCPQPDGEGVENCLVLNVFVPLEATTLPVVVIVHGGGFQSGWGSFKPPSRLLNQNFIIVTFNYRLGAFGFLCLDTDDAPGNAGLKDQVAALYWIHRNIINFGGDPLDVTVYGTESGATSVEFLLLSGVTRNFFHRAILESGSALIPSSMIYDPLSKALTVATALGYEDKGSIKDLTEFYQKVSAKKLMNTSEAFLPCLENNSHNSSRLLGMDSRLILQKGNFQHVPLLIIFINLNVISTVKVNSDKINDILQNSENLLVDNLEFDDKNTEHRVADLIKEFYFDEMQSDYDPIESYLDYENDIFTMYPIVKSATLQASKSSHPVYLMEFSYKSRNDKYNKSQNDSGYTEILNYIYARDNIEDDELIAEKLITLWSNFIKFCDPTPLTSTLVPIIWQPVSVERSDNMCMNSISYLHFDKTLNMDDISLRKNLNFWEHIYNKFYKPHTLKND